MLATGECKQQAARANPPSGSRIDGSFKLETVSDRTTCTAMIKCSLISLERGKPLSQAITSAYVTYDHLVWPGRLDATVFILSTLWTEMPGTGNHCSFVLLAEFHIYEGPQLKYQFPQPLGVDERYLPAFATTMYTEINLCPQFACNVYAS
jgi:hypothetical protein